MCDMKLSLIQAVKDHAKANYGKGGWDMVVECYEDSEIAEAIEGCTTSEEAIARLGEIADIYHDRRQGAWADGGLDSNGNLPAENDDMLYAEEEAAHIQAEHQGVSYLNADELTGYEEHCRDEQETYGDGRRCPHHPNVVIGSPCGMFDGVCGPCESAGDDAAAEAEYEEWLAALPPWMKCAPLAAPVSCTATGQAFGFDLARCESLPVGWVSQCDPDPIPF